MERYYGQLGGKMSGKQYEEHIDMRNPEHYMDLTAYNAINNIEKSESARFNRLLHTIFYICHLAGYDVVERIVLVDKKTGRVWR